MYFKYLDEKSENIDSPIVNEEETKPNNFATYLQSKKDLLATIEKNLSNFKKS